MAKKVLKISRGFWGAASRDRKELAICEELGAKVEVLTHGNVGDKLRYQKTHGFDAFYLDICPLGHSKLMMSGLFRKINTLISFFSWAHAARKFNPDIITGHDYCSLLIGWMSTVFIPKKRKPILVYDSHEFELARNNTRSKLVLWWIKTIEGFLIKRCAFTIIHCDSIADKLQEIYHCKRPVVARNIPLYWKLDEGIISEKRNEMCDSLNIPHDSFFIMLHGGLTFARHIENTIDVAHMADVPLVLLGNEVDPGCIEWLKKYARDTGFADKVLFIPAVPLDILWQYAGAASVEVVITPAICDNHYYMLPNKFFESVQSLTPLIVSDFPEMGGTVRKYGIGLTVDPEDKQAIAEAIMRLRDDKELYAQIKSNLVKAKEELCWENEKKPLYEAYAEIINA